MPSSKEILKRLKRRIGADSVIIQASELKRVSLDSSRIVGTPEALLRPQKIEDISALLQLANEYKIPVTPRGAGSATTGATTPIRGGWVLDLTDWNRIRIDAESGFAEVQAGAVTSKINQAAEKKGWFYPPDPSSLKYSTIGGNIATNAGGLRGAKYGVTRDYVLGLEGVLPNGAPVKWGSSLKKYASGLNIRDLWIGSEGTLGVVTKASLKLLPKPEKRWTCLSVYQNEDAALKAVRALLKARIVPSILEFLDRQTVSCAYKKSGEALFKKHPEGAMLLMELDGSEADVKAQQRLVQSWLNDHALQFRVAGNPEDAEALWHIRRTCSQAMFQMGNTKLNEDIVVPVRKYRDLLKYTLKLKKETGLATPTFGHVADGNFHVHIMYNRESKKESATAEKAVYELMKKVIELGGVVTGEHGIGLAKSPFLRLQHNEAEVSAMQAIKKSLDPNGIMNPGKIFETFEMWKADRDHEYVFPWQKH